MYIPDKINLELFWSPNIQLNFAKFEQVLKDLKKTTTNIQVVGFRDSDTHLDVLTKGAKGLGVKCKPSLLSLVCSGGIVPDMPICGKSWTPGEFVRYPEQKQKGVGCTCSF